MWHKAFENKNIGVWRLECYLCWKQAVSGMACPSFCNYIKSPLTWVDTFAVSPFYVELFFPENSDQFAGLRVLRVARYVNSQEFLLGIESELRGNFISLLFDFFTICTFLHPTVPIFSQCYLSVRVMRVLKLIRRSKKLMTIATVMKNCVSELFLLIVIWTMGVIVFAMLMYTFEENTNDQISSGK